MITCPVSGKPVDVQKDAPDAFHVRSWGGRWFCLKTFRTYEEASAWRESFEFPAKPVWKEEPDGRVRFTGVDWMSEAMPAQDAEAWYPKQTRSRKNVASTKSPEPSV
jgi:hypothetical protein